MLSKRRSPSEFSSIPAWLEYKKEFERRRKLAKYNPAVQRPPRSRYPRFNTRGMNARTGGYMGLEKKFVDYVFPLTAVPTGVTGSNMDPPGSQALDAIQQGDGESNRDGKNAQVKSIHVQGYFVNTGLHDRIARVVLVKDTQTNGALLNGQDVFKDPAGSDNDVNAWRNLQYSKRFQVLSDQKIHVPACPYFDGSLGASNLSKVPFVIHQNINYNQTYSGTLSTIASMVDNSVHMLIWADNVDLTVDYVSRVRFYG